MNMTSTAALIEAPLPLDYADGAACCAIRLDLDDGTLDIRSRGLWDTALTDKFLADMEVALLRFSLSGAAPRSLLTTIDLRLHSVQARETIARVQPQVHRYHEMSKRTAVILSQSALARMQAGRLLNLDRHRFFTSDMAAQRWLTTGIAD